jgi:hypothetical protein
VVLAALCAYVQYVVGSCEHAARQRTNAQHSTHTTTTVYPYLFLLSRLQQLPEAIQREFPPNVAAKASCGEPVPAPPPNGRRQPEARIDKAQIPESESASGADHSDALGSRVRDVKPTLQRRRAAEDTRGNGSNATSARRDESDDDESRSDDDDETRSDDDDECEGSAMDGDADLPIVGRRPNVPFSDVEVDAIVRALKIHYTSA